MIRVLFDRLLDLAAIDVDQSWHWPDSDHFSLEEVITAHQQGLKSVDEPYGDTWKHPVLRLKDTEYHIRRIIYFLEHPDEISSIEVDNSYVGANILPDCLIVDGHHRIAAGIILGLKYIDINYGGRGDVEDYISGRSDVRPFEIC